MDLLNQSIPVWAVAVYMAYMAAIQALPRPKEEGHPLYVFAYAFLHAISINLKLLFNPKNKPKVERLY